jgi:hypothetical protein
MHWRWLVRSRIPWLSLVCKQVGRAAAAFLGDGQSPVRAASDRATGRRQWPPQKKATTNVEDDNVYRRKKAFRPVEKA